MVRNIALITSIDPSAVVKQFEKLDPTLRAFAADALAGLLNNPMPNAIRFEKLKGNNKPPIYTIHLTPNHSHKASFEIVNGVAKLRRIGTHKQVDNSP